MRAVFSGRSSRRWSSATSTAATRAADLPGSGVRTVVRSGSLCSLAVITDHQAIERIIAHLKLTFVAAKPPPSQVFEQVSLTAAEESGDYF
jgi:hypothetical protein